MLPEEGVTRDAARTEPCKEGIRGNARHPSARADGPEDVVDPPGGAEFQEIFIPGAAQMPRGSDGITPEQGQPPLPVFDERVGGVSSGEIPEEGGQAFGTPFESSARAPQRREAGDPRRKGIIQERWEHQVGRHVAHQHGNPVLPPHFQDGLQIPLPEGEDPFGVVGAEMHGPPFRNLPHEVPLAGDRRCRIRFEKPSHEMQIAQPVFPLNGRGKEPRDGPRTDTVGPVEFIVPHVQDHEIGPEPDELTGKVQDDIAVDGGGAEVHDLDFTARPGVAELSSQDARNARGHLVRSAEHRGLSQAEDAHGAGGLLPAEERGLELGEEGSTGREILRGIGAVDFKPADAVVGHRPHNRTLTSGRPQTESRLRKDENRRGGEVHHDQQECSSAAGHGRGADNGALWFCVCVVLSPQGTTGFAGGSIRGHWSCGSTKGTSNILPPKPRMR